MSDETTARSDFLSVRDVRVSFPVATSTGIRRRMVKKLVLQDVDLDLEPGRTLGLVGESGSGKSTLARAILQIRRADSGSIRFRGEELTRLRGRRLLQMRPAMQMVFQDPMSSLSPRSKVQDILESPLVVHRAGSSAERRRRVAEVLDHVGLPADSGERYPFEFSGGQRQRIGIARALILKPALVVCDEPVSALDVSVQAQIINLLLDLQKEFGLAYLFVGHDLAVVQNVSDDVAVMRSGEIVERGPADQLFKNPQHEYTRTLIDAVPTIGTDS